ncbi:MAG: hypothetical protein ACJ790_18775 [Myxococcaceae bacterium]
MRAKPFRLACLLAVIAVAGCKKSADPAPSPTPSAPIARSDIVHFRDLRGFLPRSLPGFDQVKDEGSTGKYGEVVVSEAERVFQKKSQEVSVRIVDTSVSERLGKAITAAAKDAASRDADDPSGPLQLKNAVGFVRFDSDQDRAEANLLVGDRYVVAVTTVGYPDTREVRRLSGELDLAGLSKLR